MTLTHPNSLTRVDRALKREHPYLSNQQIDEALSLRWILIDGTPVKKGDRISQHQQFEDSLLREQVERLKTTKPKIVIPIVYESSEYIVVDKPAGIPSHPVHLTDADTITHWMFARKPEVRKQFPEFQPTLTPHRLDTGTSGLLVVAKTKSAFEKWRASFANKKVDKTYLAWCWGVPTQNRFAIADPIAHDSSDRRKMVCITETTRYRGPAQHALTEIEVIKRDRDRFMCRLKCHSGVTHQLRVHLATLGFPILGDTLYDPQHSSRPIKPLFHQLRATKLSVGTLVFEIAETFSEPS